MMELSEVMVIFYVLINVRLLHRLQMQWHAGDGPMTVRIFSQHYDQ